MQIYFSEAATQRLELEIQWNLSENHGKTMGKPWENDGLMGFNGDLPNLVMTNIANWKITIEMVDFPSYNMVIFHSYVKSSEGKGDCFTICSGDGMGCDIHGIY